MKTSQLFQTTTLYVFYSWSVLASASTAVLKPPNQPITILEPGQTEKNDIDPSSQITSPFRVHSRSFKSEKERNMHVVSKVIRSITRLLENDKTRPEQNGDYEAKQFEVPPLATVRGPNSITMDVKRLYWSLILNNGNAHSANSRLQSYLFERLLIPDNYVGSIPVDDIDSNLRQTYELLYKERAIEPPSARRSELNRLRNQLLHLRSPIILQLFNNATRIWPPHWNAFHKFLKSATTTEALSFSSRYADGKLVMDILRGLRVIFERFRDILEHSS